MEKVIYRAATEADSKEIAELSSIAEGGIIEFLLHDLIPNITPTQLFQKQVEDETSIFYFGHSLIASQNDNLVGFVQSVRSSLWLKPDEGFLPSDRIDHLLALYEPKIPESLYLLAIAVKPEARRQGIAAHFLEFVKEKARKMKFSKVTLHAWRDNENAIRLYERSGFHTIDSVKVDRHELLPHDGGLLLMSCDLIRGSLNSQFEL